MIISNQFNKFYHKCVLVDLFNKTSQLTFKHLRDTRSQGAFTIRKYEDYQDMDDLKQLLKILNLDYAVDETQDKKASTKDIDNKELINHIEWVIQVGIWNGVELDFVALEWQRLLQSCR